jgi:HEAT repeat protein
VGSYRGLAASNLASIGNEDHIPLLDKALADSTVAYTIRENAVGRAINERPTHDVQVRDMALAAAVILSRQKLEDYGFVDNFASAGGISSTGYTYSRHYIPAEKRDAMHKKWQDWRAKNP